MNVTNAAPGVYRADSYGEFSDSLDVSGLQAEKPYIYDFDFDIDGTDSATGGGRAFVYVYVEITDYVGNDAVVTDTWWSSYTGDAAISTGSPANVSGGPLTYEKFNPSDTAVLTVLVRSYADDTQGGGFSGAVGGDMASNANFLNTLTLTGASLEDSSGSVIPGSSIADTSGFVFSDVGSAPEPGTLSLLVISALFLGAVTLLRRLRSA